MSTEQPIFGKLVKDQSPRSHYYVDDTGNTVYYYIHKAEEDAEPKSKIRTVMGCWIVVKEKIYNVRTNEYTFKLVGKDILGKEINISVSSDVFYGPSVKLFAAIAPHFSLKTPYRLKKGDNLQQIIADLTPEGTTQHIKEFDQVAWDNGKLIIPGMEPQGYKCNIDKKIFPYDMPEGLDIRIGLEALEYIIKSVGIPKIMPLIISIFISPVIGKLFPDDRYGYALVGETGTLKTAVCRLLLQIYGSGFASKNTMIKLGEDGATKNAAKTIAATAGCMPVLLDNFKPYKTWSISELASLIHSLIEGSDKARLTKDSELRDSRSFYCLPLITGEDYAVDAATSARIMKLNWTKPDISILDSATPEMRKHLPAIGRVWLGWLMSEDGIKAMEKMKEEFPKVRAGIIDEFKGIKATNPDRLATNLALERLGFDLMMNHPIFGQYFRKFSEEYKSGFIKSVQSVGKATSEGSEVNVIVDMLREGIATESLSLGKDHPGYGQTVIGCCDDKYVYIYPQVLEEYASKHLQMSQKLSKSAIGQQLKSHKLIIPDKDGNPTQSKWIAKTKKTVRVYVFEADTLIDDSMKPVVAEVRDPETKKIIGLTTSTKAAAASAGGV